jgi:hypothetical protein
LQDRVELGTGTVDDKIIANFTHQFNGSILGVISVDELLRFELSIEPLFQRQERIVHRRRDFLDEGFYVNFIEKRLDNLVRRQSAGTNRILSCHHQPGVQASAGSAGVARHPTRLLPALRTWQPLLLEKWMALIPLRARAQRQEPQAVEPVEPLVGGFFPAVCPSPL